MSKPDKHCLSLLKLRMVFGDGENMLKPEEVCPCGSGKACKDCCGSKGA